MKDVKAGEVVAAVKADVKAVELSIEERVAKLEQEFLELKAEYFKVVKDVSGFFTRFEEKVVGAFKHIGHDIRSIF